VKFTPAFKTVFWTTIVGLYLSGLGTWILQNWFYSDVGYGLQRREQTTTWLHTHSVAGLFFIGMFGYLIHSHVEMGLKQRRKIKTGLLVLTTMSILVVSVPGIFYLTLEPWKGWVSCIHTYVGLAMVIPVLAHLVRFTR
jgi:hypothetical protein